MRIHSEFSELPNVPAMMWNIVEAIGELGGHATTPEILDTIMRIRQYPKYVLNIPSFSGNYPTEMSSRAALARGHLKRAGMMSKDEGRNVWSLTPEAKSLTRSDMTEIIKRNDIKRHESEIAALHKMTPQEATEFLYDKYHNKLEKIINRQKTYPGNELPEDVAQMVFMRVHRTLINGSAINTTPLHYIYSALRCLVFDLRRKNNTRIVEDQLSEHFGKISRMQATPSASDSYFKEAEALSGLLGPLNESDRQAFVKYYLDGDSLEEVAAALGTNAGAMKVRMHRARAKIAEWLPADKRPHVRQSAEPLLQPQAADFVDRLEQERSVNATAGEFPTI